MHKILIVDDEERNMKLATDILSMQGYNVLNAPNAEDGIKIATDELPNLILMDIELGGMDGLTATKILKADTRTSQIIIVVLTARAMLGDEELIRETGADDYLAKPYKYQDLISMVNKYCNNKPLH